MHDIDIKYLLFLDPYFQSFGNLEEPKIFKYISTAYLCIIHLLEKSIYTLYHIVCIQYDMSLVFLLPYIVMFIAFFRYEQVLIKYCCTTYELKHFTELPI